MFEDGPRNWKWMAPAALIAPLVVWWSAWWGSEAWNELAMIPLCLGGIALVAAGVNLWLYVQRRYADIYADVQVARTATPEVRMLEAARTLHPETVKALLVHRRTIWKIKYVAQKDLTDWILDEAQTVHAGFVDFVLDHSNGVSLMPKRLLSEGSTHFDPDGIVMDYQQYDDLLFLMQQKLMCTQAFGNQPPHFLPPWNVELLRKRFGLEGTAYEVDEEVSEGMRSVIGNSESRAPLPASTQASPQMRLASNLGGESGDVPDVISKAMEGLQQTQLMKARMRGS